MNLNKCCRCGCFYSSEGNVCPNCQPKDFNEIAKLKIILMSTLIMILLSVFLQILE